MDYKEIVKSSLHDDENEMWKSVDRINGFLEHLKERHTEEVARFLKEEYEALNGKHLNEAAAKSLVSEMYHRTDNGEVIKGEMVYLDEAVQLLAGMEGEDAKKCQWDAYVGANGFAHDLANSGLSKSDILKAAKLFWFHDDDFAGDKVYWYYSDMLFKNRKEE